MQSDTSQEFQEFSDLNSSVQLLKRVLLLKPHSYRADASQIGAETLASQATGIE